MAIRSSVVVGCDTCEIEGIPDNTTVPKGWINFSHRHVEGGITTYYFCSVECMNRKLETIIEVRKTKLRRTSGASNKVAVEYDDWPDGMVELIEQRARELHEERVRRAPGISYLPPGEEALPTPQPHPHPH